MEPNRDVTDRPKPEKPSYGLLWIIAATVIGALVYGAWDILRKVM
jgi:hypothetical protein